MLIVESQSLDVHRNLAIEEYLMVHAASEGPVLFLWRSDCAVVMGKNQNPWRECRLDLMAADNVPLARRISGGGTVYHDAGNLNYCIIVDRRDYQEQQAYDLVIQALEPFGIRAERTGRSNLSMDGLKFSGNAFCFRGGRALHHGTLLLDADLARLNRYLGAVMDGIETHAIASVPAPVGNLQLDGAALSAMLIEQFRNRYGGGDPVRLTEEELDSQVLGALIRHQLSDAWRYGATPRFVLQHDGLRLEIVRNIVVGAQGRHDAKTLIDKHFSEIAFSLLC